MYFTIQLLYVLFTNFTLLCVVWYYFQLVEGLTFLHNDAKILQGSLAPEMIVITKNGQWKIAGLFFSSTPVVIDGQVTAESCYKILIDKHPNAPCFITSKMKYKL